MREDINLEAPDHELGEQKGIPELRKDASSKEPDFQEDRLVLGLI